MRKTVACIIVAILMSGCVTGWMGPMPMSKRWAHDERQQRELKARRERIGKPLFGRADTGNKDKPLAILGGETGLGAELQGTSGGSVHYRYSW
ncbi:MAG: hypothetical protein NTZ09_02155 [Candidatus Hydrogenedentes bacterium]|nr:hypothetical protein [Candidatus Hydrogenedentota bacterium]